MNLEAAKPFLYWLGVMLFLALELSFSYRQPSVSKLKRWLTNVPLSIFNGIIYFFIYSGVISALFRHVDSQNLGLLNRFDLANWIDIFLGIAILDFFIYVWHLLNHKMPLLWRFHKVHHCDMNMDVSTAGRFHLGEFLLSGMVRMVVIYTFGISFTAYILFEILMNVAIQFHHSCIKISSSFEQFWWLLFVPPSMHRIHHSIRIKESDSNYGVLFSLWDRLTGTMIADTDQKGIIIGIDSSREFEKLGFGHMLLMPFTKKSRQTA